MKEFDINNNKFRVPEEWRDIKLRHFESFINDKPQSRKERVEYVAKICKCEAHDLLAIPAEVFDVMLDSLSFIFSEWKAHPSANIEIDGIKYGVNAEDSLTLGEWIDVEEAQKGDKAISGVLAVVCRPIGEAYDSNNTSAREAMFSELPVDKVLPLISFFYKRKIALETLSQASLMAREYRKTIPSSTEILRNVGGGTKLSTIWRMGRFWIMTIFLRAQLAKFSRN